MPSSHRRVAGSRRRFPWKPCSPCSGVIRGRAEVGVRLGKPVALAANVLGEQDGAELLEPGRRIQEHVEDRHAVGDGEREEVGGWRPLLQACRLWAGSSRRSRTACSRTRASSSRTRASRTWIPARSISGNLRGVRDPGVLRRLGVGLGRAVSDPAEAGRAAAARAKVAGVSRSAWATCARCDARANGSRECSGRRCSRGRVSLSWWLEPGIEEAPDRMRRGAASADTTGSLASS